MRVNDGGSDRSQARPKSVQVLYQHDVNKREIIPPPRGAVRPLHLIWRLAGSRVASPRREPGNWSGSHERRPLLKVDRQGYLTSSRGPGQGSESADHDIDEFSFGNEVFRSAEPSP